MLAAHHNPPNQEMLAERWQQVRARIAAVQAPQRVQLLAVSKTQPASVVAALAALGQTAFGENYAQEGVAKITALRSQPPTPHAPLTWHFIGPLQSNKTRLVAEHFDWVQSVDRPKLAERLAAQRPSQLAPLNICIEVNASGEASKGGVTLEGVDGADAVIALARVVLALPALRLRGLMCIPAPGAPSTQYHAVQQCMQALQGFVRHAFPARAEAIDTLSMGMSDDLETAITHGATLVRVGTALFGPRGLPAPTTVAA